MADADGEPALRRVVRSAWAGGAMPVVAVIASATAQVSAILADLPVALVVAEAGSGPGIAWFALGLRTATVAVTEATAGLLWPCRYAWVDPETVTSLLEAHGADQDQVCRAAFAGQPGFPILIPAALEPRLAAMTGLHGEEAIEGLIFEGVEQRILEMGDPGIVNDLATPRSSLPPYQGPSGPAGGPPPQWNAELAASAQVSDDTTG
jgi:CTP:molybdopterin cytidylyltransferase MocA